MEQMSGQGSLNNQAIRILLEDIDLAIAEGCDRWVDSVRRPETVQALIHRHNSSRCPSRTVGGDIVGHTSSSLLNAIANLIRRHSAPVYSGTSDEFYAFGSATVEKAHLEKIGYKGPATVSGIMSSIAMLDD